MYFACVAVILASICSTLQATSIPTAASYRVNGLEKYGSRDIMYAGQMALNFNQLNTEGSFFFWLAKQRNNTDHKPKKLIVWLNGGPGCSSMVGFAWENGPFTIHQGTTEKYDLKYNPYSWNEVADVIWVEQPIRTGFSLAAKGSPIIRTEKQIGQDFRAFLLSLYQVFPEYKGVDLYLTGESYAGFYIPWIAEAIVSPQFVQNPDKTWKRDVSLDNINLQGAAIGNGVLDFIYQEPSYAEYAYTHGLIPLGAKKKFDMDWSICLESIQNEKKPLTRSTFNRCEMMSKVLEAAGKPNEYNTATFIGYEKIMKKGDPFDAFFQDPEIQSLLHVRGIDLPGLNFIPENYEVVQASLLSKDGVATGSSDPSQPGFVYAPVNGWSVCNEDINDQMGKDHPTTAVPVLQFLTDFTLRYANWDKKSSNHLRIMLYSGEFDLNCNTLGTLHTLEANHWRNRPWISASRNLWKNNNEEVYGEYFHFDEIFSFLIVRNSGHLMPMDIPKPALEMLTRFIHGKTFADVNLPSEESYLREMEDNQLTNNNNINNKQLALQSKYFSLLVVIFAGILVILIPIFYRAKKIQQVVFPSSTSNDSLQSQDLPSKQQSHSSVSSSFTSGLQLNYFTSKPGYQPIPEEA